jgi:hypothetical protein
MQRRLILVWSVLSLLTSACSSAMGNGPRPSYGIVVVSGVAKNATVKSGVLAISDSGQQLFGHSKLAFPGGSNSSFGGAGLPNWVQVTWREGNIVQDFKTGGWKGGAIVGDYKVEVASRIPPDVQKYASEKPGRAIRLKFQIRDDAVLLAWDVQETSANGQGWVRSMPGGDFEDDEIDNGKLVKKGWYLDKNGQKVPNN